MTIYIWLGQGSENDNIGIQVFKEKMKIKLMTQIMHALPM